MPPRQKKAEVIINRSIQLFNEFGVSEVTTNHIAENLEMSPGNLYYYFPNKEAIIREIFAQVRTKIESLWEDRDLSPLLLLNQYVHVVFNIIFGYRFFFSELSLILRRDPLIRDEYMDLQSCFKKELASLFLQLNHAGVFISLEAESQRHALANSVWIVSIYWHCYLESAPEKPIQTPSHELLHHILFLTQPYIHPQYLDVVKGIFAEFLQQSQLPEQISPA
ncbi:MAG: TetR/AcrR family transcriptional regulator [Oligoflexus sp.]